MKMYLAVQVFSAIVSVMLLITFYILLAVGVVSGQNLLTPLLLIVVAIILLAILAMLAKVEYYLHSYTKGGKKK